MKHVFILSCILILFCFTGCKKEITNEENNKLLENNYAINETKSKEEIEQLENDTTNYIDPYFYEPEEIIEYETYEYIHYGYTYNVEKDKNEDLVTDIHNISIDGKMIHLPCSYTDLSKIFQLYSVEISRYDEMLSPVNEKEKKYSFELRAIPETGEGTISFMFTSDTEKEDTIQNMMCKEVILSCNSYHNEKIMTLALPKEIKFGVDFAYLKNIYQLFDSTNINNSGSNWSATTMHDNLDYTIFFIGSDYGLQYIDICYD